MPLYEFKCRRCHTTVHMQARIAEEPCECGGLLRRVFSFSFKRPMPEHYNSAVGHEVSSERALKSELKQMGDDLSARTGIPHNFVPVDPRDKETLGVTDEGLDSTFDADVKSGKREPAKKWV